MTEKIKCGRYTVELTHPDKIWFPTDRITKRDAVSYYHDIAPFMVPLMKDRPVSMQRFPDGLSGESFFQKEASAHFPSWIKQVTVKKEGGVVHHVVCQNQATLVYLANQGVLTPHIWLSKEPKLNFPDRMIFDLDPSGADFSSVREAALLLKNFFETLSVTPLVMTTGSRGLHVVVPLKPKSPFDEVRAFARDVAAHVVAGSPKKYTNEVRKEKRRGRLFFDVARNAYAQTGVAPYAIRARAGAPVATPLAWEEVEDKKLTADRYTIKTVLKRLEKIDDPWRNADAVLLGTLRKKFDALGD